MKPKPRWISLFALFAALPLAPSTQAGVIMISTRKGQDTAFSTEYRSDPKGPGMVTPGDVAMVGLLGDSGYSCRLMLDALLGAEGAAKGFDPAEVYLHPTDEALKIDLLIVSGSGASADAPPPPDGIPVIMGEHVTLGNNTGRQGSIFMYAGTKSDDPNEGDPLTTKYMKVIAKDHPIFQGIVLDNQDRVKIFREPYPGEEAHVPAGGKKNFEFRWCAQAVADAAPATKILGVLDGKEDRAVFAVADVGGLMANELENTSRKVHLFINENGSGGSRRGFLALTDVGRLLFVRAARWAMGEELEPAQQLKILDVTPAPQGRLSLSWQSTLDKSFSIQARSELTAGRWQTVVSDIPGLDGVSRRLLDVSAVSTPLFLRIQSTP